MKIAYSNPWFSVVQDGKHHYIDEPKSRNGAAVFIRHGNGSFILVEIFRVPTGKSQLEIPRGYAEDGETSLACAIREAKEETGFRIRADRITRIGSVSPNSAILSSKVDLYFAQVEDEDKVAQPEEEVEAVTLLSENELKQNIVDEVITDSFTISAFLQYQLRDSMNR